MQTSLKDDEYYIDGDGLLIFTAKYHLARGYCCGLECKECPFLYESVGEPRRTLLIEQQNFRKGARGLKTDD